MTVGLIQLIHKAMSTLLTEIEAFCAAHDMAPTRFGELALNDKPFVSQLKTNRRLWPETEAKVRQFMRDYRPQPRTPGKAAA